MNGLLDKLKETGLARSITDPEQIEIAKCGFGTGRCGSNPHLAHLTNKTIKTPTTRRPDQLLLVNGTDNQSIKDKSNGSDVEALPAPGPTTNPSFLDDPAVIIIGGLVIAGLAIALAFGGEENQPMSGT